MNQPLSRFSEDVADALAAVRSRTDRRPEVALVLGSGLGGLADLVTDPVTFRTGDLPGYPASTVEGHSGRLVLGELESRTVAVVQGRVHLYEGHTIRKVTFPVRLIHALGARRLIVTNAAGGIHSAFSPGTLMFIVDHINAAFASPLAGPNDDLGPRFLDMSEPYCLEWTNAAEEVASRLGIATERGVYLWTAGPSYETKAEVRFHATIGADAVGMSTVPEVIQARHLGMEVLGLSTITNRAAGTGNDPLDHEDVLEVGQMVREKLEKLVCAIVRET